MSASWFDSWARLTPFGRRLLADRILELGWPVAQAAESVGVSRLSDLDRTTGTPIRYVRDCPGELVHVDIKKLGKIPDGGGWRVLVRSRQKVGYEDVRYMVEYHTHM